MHISTTHLERSLQTLERSLAQLNKVEDKTDIDYEVYRNAVIKGFELSLEVCGKLLRKALKAYGGSPKEVDALFYNDVFRRCAKHGLLDVALVERWFLYRYNRNNTAHDYGEHFATETLELLPSFLSDAFYIIQQLKQTFGEQSDA
ncbi:MAG: nucleotidyltransferase substrate binding protein [Vampirovibrionales bacterium]